MFLRHPQPSLQFITHRSPTYNRKHTHPKPLLNDLLPPPPPREKPRRIPHRQLNPQALHKQPLRHGIKAQQAGHETKCPCGFEQRRAGRCVPVGEREVGSRVEAEAEFDCDEDEDCGYVAE